MTIKNGSLVRGNRRQKVSHETNQVDSVT